jgi:hypothetical protein
MNSKGSQPPALAVWLLRRLCHKGNDDALAGDLFEKFGERQSDGWFWRQVLIAILVGVSTELRVHWPQICFSLAGTPLLWFSSTEIIRTPAIERLWAWGIGLPWPMSTAYDFGFQAALAALMVQPILAALLLLDRTFSWSSATRTLLISFALLAAAQSARFLWISHLPSPMTRFLFMALMPSVALLISAWFGCRLPLGSRNLRGGARRFA